MTYTRRPFLWCRGLFFYFSCVARPGRQRESGAFVAYSMNSMFTYHEMVSAELVCLPKHGLRYCTRRQGIGSHYMDEISSRSALAGGRLIPRAHTHVWTVMFDARSLVLPSTKNRYVAFSPATKPTYSPEQVHLRARTPSQRPSVQHTRHKLIVFMMIKGRADRETARFIGP